MIIIFRALHEPIQVKINDQRQLSFATRFTNYEYQGIDQLSAIANSDEEDVAITKMIIESLPTMEWVKRYIIREFQKQGLVFHSVMEQ